MLIKQKIQSAQWFVDAINQRNNTLLKTMKTIVDLQKKFFEDGDELGSPLLSPGA